MECGTHTRTNTNTSAIVIEHVHTNVCCAVVRAQLIMANKSIRDLENDVFLY